MAWQKEMRFTLNRKRSGILLSFGLLLATAGLTGCSQNQAQGVFMDSVADLAQEVDPTLYLNLELLNQEGEKESWNGYEIYTLDYGTFETGVNGIQADVNMVEVSPVRAEFQHGSMYLTELCVSKYSYVKKGDVIAKVTSQTDTLDLEELHRRMLRLEEAYEEYKEEYEEEHQEKISNRSVYKLIREIEDVEIRQMELEHEKMVQMYETGIADCWEEILAFQAAASTTQILAPQSGFVLDVARFSVGDEIANGTILCEMAPTDKLMIEFGDETGHYGYGMHLTLSVGEQGVGGTYDVQVVSALQKTLDDGWNDAATKVVGDYDIAELMNSRSFRISGTTNVMEHVLLVPVSAVTSRGDKNYVTILHEDNTTELKQFIAGGKNTQYYWVYEGLDVGTKIVIEN